MSARCGSEDASHRIKDCRPCQAQRLREWRKRTQVPKRMEAFCVMCGIGQGNPSGINVTRYPLIRYIAAIRSNRNIASLPLCDPCVRDYATPSPSYMKAHGAGFASVDRDDGLRARSVSTTVSRFGAPLGPELSHGRV